MSDRELALVVGIGLAAARPWPATCWPTGGGSSRSTTPPARRHGRGPGPWASSWWSTRTSDALARLVAGGRPGRPQPRRARRAIPCSPAAADAGRARAGRGRAGLAWPRLPGRGRHRHQRQDDGDHPRRPACWWRRAWPPSPPATSACPLSSAVGAGRRRGRGRGLVVPAAVRRRLPPGGGGVAQPGADHLDWHPDVDVLRRGQGPHLGAPGAGRRGRRQRRRPGGDGRRRRRARAGSSPSGSDGRTGCPTGR